MNSHSVACRSFLRSATAAGSLPFPGMATKIVKVAKVVKFATIVKEILA